MQKLTEPPDWKWGDACMIKKGTYPVKKSDSLSLEWDFTD